MSNPNFPSQHNGRVYLLEMCWNEQGWQTEGTYASVAAAVGQLTARVNALNPAVWQRVARTRTSADYIGQPGTAGNTVRYRVRQDGYLYGTL